MKRLIIFSLLAIFLLSQSAFAQTELTNKNAELTHFEASFPNTKVDSLTSIYSTWFTLRGYEETQPYILQTDTSGSLAQTYYPDKIFYTYKFSSTTGKPRITWIVQGSNDLSDTSQHFAVDTLSAVGDSTETWQYNSVDFNGKRFLNYRFYFKTVAANRADTYVRATIYKPKKKLQ